MYRSITRLLHIALLAATASCAEATVVPVPVSPATATSSPTTEVAASAVDPSAAELPPGTAVVYADAAGVWAIEPGAPPRRLATVEGAQAPLIAPSRAWVTYETWRDVTATEQALWLVPFAGGEPRRVLETGQLPQDDEASEMGFQRWIAQVQWVPGTDDLLFATSEYNTHQGLWTLDAATGAIHQCLTIADGGAFEVSPDGQWVAFSRTGWETRTDASISAVRVDGTDAHVLLRYPRVSTDSDFVVYAAPMWLPDSRHLVVATLAADTDGLAPANPPVGVVLHRLSLDGPAVELGRLPSDVEVNATSWYEPNFRGIWSPDGRQLAYVVPSRAVPAAVATDSLATAYPPPPNPSDWSDLVVASADGSGAHAVASAATLIFAGWDPDGTVRFSGDGKAWVGGAAPSDRPVPVPGLAWWNRARAVGRGHWLILSDEPGSAPGDDLVLVREDGTRTLLAGGVRGYDLALSDSR